MRQALALCKAYLAPHWVWIRLYGCGGGLFGLLLLVAAEGTYRRRCILIISPPPHAKGMAHGINQEGSTLIPSPRATT